MGAFGHLIVEKLAREFREASLARINAQTLVWQAEDEMESIRRRAESMGITREQVEAEVHRQREEERR